MYSNYYGFSEKPFDVTPDPRFLYLTPDHRETLASLIYGIKERRGFITITGEVGTGKTTLLNAALERLDNKIRVAFIFNTDVTFEQMLSMALYEWGLLKPKDRLSKVNAIQRLNRFAIQQWAKGGNVVLIVDEAQNLNNNLLENLRLLSNLETQKHKQVQIVLSGQPELDIKLRLHELRQFTQRISLRRYVSPLDEKDTYAYLKHRLAIAKYSGPSLFSPKAQQLIWEYSGGVPRKINILCDNAFLIGYGLQKKKIHAAVVQEAAQDLKWSRCSDTKASLNSPSAKISVPCAETKPLQRHLTVAASIFIVGIFIFAGSFFLSSTGFKFTRLTNFISGAKKASLEKIQPNNTTQQTQLTFYSIPIKTVKVPNTLTEGLPRENIEPEALKETSEKSNLDGLTKKEKQLQRIKAKKKENLHGIISEIKILLQGQGNQ